MFSVGSSECGGGGCGGGGNATAGGGDNEGVGDDGDSNGGGDADGGGGSSGSAGSTSFSSGSFLRVLGPVGAITRPLSCLPERVVMPIWGGGIEKDA